MISSTVNRVFYWGNGQTTIFPLQFTVHEKKHVKVLLVKGSGEERLLVKDYFVDFTQNAVIYPGYPPGQQPPKLEQPQVLPAGWQLVIYREVEATQEEDLGQRWPFKTIERMMDKLTMLVQQVKEKLSSCVSLPVGRAFDGQLPSPVQPNATLAINADGTGLRYGANPDDAGSALVLAKEADGKSTEALVVAKDAVQMVAGQLEHIDSQVVEAVRQADLAGGYAQQAGVSAQAASLHASLYDEQRVYEPPEMAIVNGQTYRCIEKSVGEEPPSSAKWLLLALVAYETFEVDVNGDLMPLLKSQASLQWAIDEDGDIMPAS